MKLTEKSRKELLAKSKSSDSYALNNQQDGKNRYQRRLKQRVSRSTAEYNQMDMNKLFKDDIFDVVVPVNGETDNYKVSISFGGIVNELQTTLAANDAELSQVLVLKALIKAFNDGDVYFRCTCPDAQYRQNYWASKNDIINGPPETRPSDITNPKDTKGGACKHVAMVLSNNSWLIKCASVIYNYINYMKSNPSYERSYQEIIYPALYGKPYDGNVQLDLDDFTNKQRELDSTQTDAANKAAKSKNWFKPGNATRFRPSDNIKGQQSFNFEDEISNTTKKEK